jgi:perosamine synthetase
MSNFKYPVANPHIGKNERTYVDECIDSHWISSSGKYISAFEDNFAKTFGPGKCVAVNSGTIAIDLALEAVGISPGDEVMVPNFTFAGSVSPIYRLHAIPVLIPPSKDSWNLDPSQLKKFLTPKTKAIIAVHLYGQPCDIKAILSFAKEHNLAVIEDAAEALGAKVDGQYVGTFGDIGCFSFFGNKVLTTGEGGMCLCKNDELANSIRLYRDHGMTNDERYWHKVIGYNGRMTNMQAAVGLGQLERIHSLIEKRMEIHNIYQDEFNQTDFFKKINIPSGTEIVNWLESPVLKDNCSLNRNDLINDLESDSIETRPFFYPVSRMPAYSRFGHNDDASDYFSGHGINLPTYTQLNEDDVKTIAQSVCKHLKNQYKKDSFHTVPLQLPQNSSPSYKPDVSIILPTFNEALNVCEIISILRNEMVAISKDYEILVIDEKSTDGTIEKIKTTYPHDSNIKVHIREERQGLAAAIYDGIQKATGDYVLIMDTDFNHDPHMAGKIVKFSEFFDIVSGSRFTTGGSVESTSVWLCSYIYNLMLRILLGLKTKDNLAGYFCIRREKLLKLNASFIYYGHGDYFFRLLHLAQKQDFTLLEVPISYKTNKSSTTSKNFLWTLMVYTKRALKLKFLSKD